VKGRRDLTVEIGRIVLINYGPDAGKIGTIIDIVDQNKALIDGPAEITGVSRQVLNFRSMALTPLVVPIPRAVRPSTLAKALAKAKTLESWNASNWARKLAKQHIRSNLSDFDRFRSMVSHKAKAQLVGREMARLKRAGSAPALKPRPVRKVIPNLRLKPAKIKRVLPTKYSEDEDKKKGKDAGTAPAADTKKKK